MAAPLAVFAIGAAAASTSATLTLNGTISPSCSFTTAPGGATFQLQPGVVNVGELGYTCNLPEGSSAGFTLQISNGGLKNEASGQVVAYDVQWNVPPNDGTQVWQDAATFLGGVYFSWPVSAPGVERSGLFRIRINALPAGLAAGQYNSVVTYTISP